MDVELYKKAMEVVHLFNTKLSNDYRTKLDKNVTNKLYTQRRLYVLWI